MSFITWKQSRGTILAYRLHAKILEDATGKEILSLFCVKWLAQELAGLKPFKFDMCPNSHVAFTGAHKDLDSCPGFNNTKDRKKVPCHHPLVVAIFKNITGNI